MAPQIRDLSLTATERTAITAVLQTEETLARQMAQVQADKAAIAADIEKRLRLPAGALGDEPSHHVSLDDWKVEPIPSPNGKP